MSGKDGDVTKRGRRDRLIEDPVTDPYMTRDKPKEPTVCTECGVVFGGGRWQWRDEVPEGAHPALCPACQRIRDEAPAGLLSLGGDFWHEHREEIVNLIHNKVEEQKRDHPMKRLMGIEDEEDGTSIASFTDMHLPRGVGQAIERAYEGELDITYPEGGGIVRVTWRR